MVLSRNLYFTEQIPHNEPHTPVSASNNGPQTPASPMTRLVNAGVLPPMNMPGPMLSKNKSTRSLFAPVKARPSRKNRKNRKSTRKNSRR